MPAPLPREFYDRPPEVVAPALLGKLLFSRAEGKLCVGRIVETEAYLSANDPACHAHRGPNRKNASMFGPPGRGYVYMIHAKWCFNVVTQPTGVGSAVLIRAVEPLVGIPIMQRRRARERLMDLTRGPARLCQALGITKKYDGWDLTRGRVIWIEHAPDEITRVIHASPRIGISSAQELMLRFFESESVFVSGPRTGLPLE